MSNRRRARRRGREPHPLAEWNRTALYELCPERAREAMELCVAEKVAANPVPLVPEGENWIRASFIAGVMLGGAFTEEQLMRLIMAHLAQPKTTPHNYVFNVYTLHDQLSHVPPFDGMTAEQVVQVFENMPTSPKGDELGVMDLDGETALYELQRIPGYPES